MCGFYSPAGKGHDCLSHKSSPETVMEIPHHYNCEEVRRVQIAFSPLCKTSASKLLLDLSPVVGKPHWEVFQDQPLAEGPLLWNSPQDQLVFPTDRIFETFIFCREDQLVFLHHLPTSIRRLPNWSTGRAHELPHLNSVPDITGVSLPITASAQSWNFLCMQMTSLHTGCHEMWLSFYIHRGLEHASLSDSWWDVHEQGIHP